MKHKAGYVFILTFLCLLLSSFSVFAGEWCQDSDDKWQYIDDDGDSVTGWLELEEGTYYLDSHGFRKEECWVKDKGNWYFFDEDGLLVTDAWVDNYYVGEDGRKKKQR